MWMWYGHIAFRCGAQLKWNCVLHTPVTCFRGGSRVFVEEGFDLRLSSLCIQLARLS